MLEKDLKVKFDLFIYFQIYRILVKFVVAIDYECFALSKNWITLLCCFAFIYLESDLIDFFFKIQNRTTEEEESQDRKIFRT